MAGCVVVVDKFASIDPVSFAYLASRYSHQYFSKRLLYAFSLRSVRWLLRWVPAR